MKINFLLSDTTKGASSLALAEVSNRAQKNLFDNFLVIVPETKSIIIERELLDLSKSGAYQNLKVYSFVRLLGRIGGTPAEKIISKQTCVLLLRKIIYESHDKLGCFKRASKSVGFAEKIYDTIAQLKSSNITPAELEVATKTENLTLRAKLSDILLIYKKYEEALSGRFFDDCDRLNLLKDLAKTSDEIASSEIFVVGFDSITSEMESVLTELAKHAKEITFSCVFLNEKSLDSKVQTNELFKRFTRIADKLNFAYTPKFVSTTKKGDFYALRHNLFSVEQTQADPQGQVSVFHAKTKKQEIDFVASTILKGVRAGRRFKDFGVMLLALDEDSSLVKKAFDAYGIPHFINTPHQVSGHILIELIKSAFSLVKFNLQTEKVLVFVSNPLFRSKNLGKFISYVAETGASYQDFLGGVDEIYSQTHQDCTEIEADLEKLKKIYKNLKDKIFGARVVDDYLNAIKFLLNALETENQLAELAKFESDALRLVEAEISLAISGKIEALFQQMSSFFGDVEVSLDEFIQIFLSGVNSIKINLSPVSIDCVVVQDNTDGFYNIKEMFIVGATEGKFPAKISDSGIILDSELEEGANQIGKSIEPLVSDINRRESFKIFEALFEPSEKLYVSFSEKSLAGSICQPARLVLKICKFFKGEEDFMQSHYDRVVDATVQASERILAQTIAKFLKSEEVYSQVSGLYGKLRNFLSEPFARALSTINLKPNFNLKQAGEMSLFGAKTSVSRIETYMSCPYKYFARYTLGLRERENYKVSGLDVGNILHTIAELFFKQNDVKNLNDGEIEKLSAKLVLTALEKNKIRADKNVALVKIISDEAVRLCKFLADEQKKSNFKVKETEFEFGKSQGVEVYAEKGKKISLVGKIDRIDEFGDYIRIVDYKTGEIKGDFKSIYFGKEIQLPAYLIATEGRQKNKVAGLFYLPIHSKFLNRDEKLGLGYKMQGFILDDAEVVHNMDITLSDDHTKSDLVPLQIKKKSNTSDDKNFEFGGKKSEKVLNSAEFEDLKSYTKQLCKTATAEILEGYIEPLPINDDNSERPNICKYCEFFGVCGVEKSRFPLGRHLSGVVKIDSFKEVHSGREEVDC